jgi:hypothetical protein
MTTKDNTNKNDSNLLGRFKLPQVKAAIERELDGTATSADTMLILKEFELANFIRSSFIRSRKEYIPEVQRSLKLQLQERFNRE